MNSDEREDDGTSELWSSDEDIAAIRDAIIEWRSGDEGIPLELAFDRVRLGVVE